VFGDARVDWLGGGEGIGCVGIGGRLQQSPDASGEVAFEAAQCSRRLLPSGCLRAR
jgi:hypothetical protein